LSVPRISGVRAAPSGESCGDVGFPAASADAAGLVADRLREHSGAAEADRVRFADALERLAARGIVLADTAHFMDALVDYSSTDAESASRLASGFAVQLASRRG
jgi:hypothetical protein